MCAWGLSEWGDVANIIIAVASVATAIVTAVVLWKQYHLQQEQHILEKEKLNAQQLEHQPSFHSEYIKEEDKRVISCDCYDMWSTAHIELTTIIAIQIYLDYDRTAGYYIPIRYYTSKDLTFKTRGILATYTNGDFLNNARIEKLLQVFNDEVRKKVPPTQLVSVFSTDIAKIEYSDQYRIKRMVYFLGNDKSTERRYNEFTNIAKCVSKHLLKLNEIDVEDTINQVMKAQYIQYHD